MSNLNVEKLLEALDVETNENIMNLTTAKIKEMNLKILKELRLNKKNTLELLTKLDGYKYVDEMNDLKSGTYLRWIPVETKGYTLTKGYHLTKGAVFCELKVTDDGLNLVLKNYGFSNKHFTIKMDDNIVFQKLTSQELVILSALDHLSD
jgi:hypothetical protein